MFESVAAVLGLAAVAVCHSAHDSVTSTLSFLSRPDLHPPRIDVSVLDKSRLSDGLLFLTVKSSNVDSGPYIYNEDGHLVWSGAGEVAAGRVMNFHKCHYNNQPHLCFFQGNGLGSTGRGFHTILDHNYRTVATVRSNQALSNDFHEFLLAANDTAIVSYYQPAPFDLTQHNKSGLGWILESGFQRISLLTGEIIFDWNSLDHIDLSESDVCPETAGTSSLTAWDYIHINSVEMNEAGDYLISGRMTSTIYKISGRDGSILWRLGGMLSSFELVDFDFSYQHHARFVSESENKTVISVFNNGASTSSQTEGATSSGMLVEINHLTLQARLLRAHQLSNLSASLSQGSVQLISSGVTSNMLIAWGSQPIISEFTNDDDLVWNVSLADTHASTYRVFKELWHGFPTDRPTMWCYAKSLDSPLAFYTSWNGATEVVYWRFHIGHASVFDHTWTFLSEVKRSGFETFHLSTALASGHEYAFVEALSVAGQSLGNSSTVRVFIPGSELASYCSLTGCPPHESIGSSHELPHLDVSQPRISAIETLYDLFCTEIELPVWMLLALPIGLHTWRQAVRGLKAYRWAMSRSDYVRQRL